MLVINKFKKNQIIIDFKNHMFQIIYCMVENAIL